MIQIKLNGEERTLFGQDAPTVAELIERLRLTPSCFAVAVNRVVVPRSRHAEVRVQAGDDVEIVHPMGGG